MGVSARTRSAVPVVSVGNITVGGTGKTPVVIDLADRLSAQGLKVAILSRGYGRISKARAVIVSNGAGPLVKVEECGDEPYVMARAVPSATVIVGSKRVETAKLATEEYGAQIILLDDGFQHVQLKRDIDILLFDYNDDPDELALLPRGRLREPLAALGRATAIVITKIPHPLIRQKGESSAGQAEQFDQEVMSRLQHLRALLSPHAPSATIHYVRFEPNYLLTQTKEASGVVSLTQLSGKRVMALCGIARPESFFASLADLDTTVVAQISFSDHHWFGAHDIEQISRRFTESGADYIVTTEKDLVRLHLPDHLGSVSFALMLEPVWLDALGKTMSMPPLVTRVQALAEATEKEMNRDK
jgi:tetraacyldisaccharide 4'-kinase